MNQHVDAASLAAGVSNTNRNDLEPLICNLSRLATATALISESVRQELSRPKEAKGCFDIAAELEALFAFLDDVKDQAQALRSAFYEGGEAADPAGPAAQPAFPTDGELVLQTGLEKLVKACRVLLIIHDSRERELSELEKQFPDYAAAREEVETDDDLFCEKMLEAHGEAENLLGWFYKGSVRVI